MTFLATDQKHKTVNQAKNAVISKGSHAQLQQQTNQAAADAVIFVFSFVFVCVFVFVFVFVFQLPLKANSQAQLEQQVNQVADAFIWQMLNSILLGLWCDWYCPIQLISFFGFWYLCYQLSWGDFWLKHCLLWERGAHHQIIYDQYNRHQDRHYDCRWLAIGELLVLCSNAWPVCT